MNNLLLVRVSVASVWLYQGLWCKLLGRAPHDQAVVASIPYLEIAQTHALLLALGAVECLLAMWVLCGRWTRSAALAQTILLAAMNAGGVIWASRVIPDPVGMLFQNFAFLVLAWIAAGELHLNAAHA